MYEQKREKERKLDQRDSQLFKMREMNSSLRDLARNKQLDQREKLKSSLDTTQDMLSAREDEVKASRIDASHSGGFMPQKTGVGTESQLLSLNRRKCQQNIVLHISHDTRPPVQIKT